VRKIATLSGEDKGKFYNSQTNPTTMANAKGREYKGKREKGIRLHTENRTRVFESLLNMVGRGKVFVWQSDGEAGFNKKNRS